MGWFENEMAWIDEHPDFPRIYLESREREKTKYVRKELDLDIEALANKLWEKIYNKPSIIPCPYCKSHNAVTNSTCVQCGGPLGA